MRDLCFVVRVGWFEWLHIMNIQIFPFDFQGCTVDDSEILCHQLRLVLYPIIYRVLYIVVGLISSINSIRKKKKKSRLCDTIRSFQSVQGAIPGRFWTKMFAEFHPFWGALILKKSTYSAFLFRI